MERMQEEMRKLLNRVGVEPEALGERPRHQQGTVERRAKAAEAAGWVPPRYRACTFDSYVPVTPEQAKAKRWVQRWAQLAAGREDDPPRLVLVGNTGVGKSHLLWAAAQQVDEALRPGDVMATNWPHELALVLRYGSEEQRRYRRKQVGRARALLVDDVGVTGAGDMDRYEVARLVQRAYDYKVPLLMTTNVHPLEQWLPPPTVSRVVGLLVIGPDKREEG